MTDTEQKMFGHFLRLGQPRFSTGPGEDAHDFIFGCEERLYNLGLLESHRVDYTTFQLDGPSKQWWRAHIAFRMAESPVMTWSLFYEAFMAKYLPRGDCEYLRDEFIQLRQDATTIFEYETHPSIGYARVYAYTHGVGEGPSLWLGFETQTLRDYQDLSGRWSIFSNSGGVCSLHGEPI